MKQPIHYFNGQYLNENDIQIPITNRSFRYGDGLFESMALFQGKIPLLNYHYQRMSSGLQALQMSWKLDVLELETIITTLTRKNDCPNARIRCLLYRKGAGLYTPQVNEVGLLIECKAMNQNGFILNKKGLDIGLYTDIYKTPSPISHFKTNNALVYILAAKYKQTQALDDCLVINHVGEVIEAVSSNVFIIHKGIIKTPPLSAGPVGGTMRQYILDQLEQYGIPYKLINIHPDLLLEADELFLTNAVQGIRWVHAYGDKTYTNQQVQEICNFVGVTCGS